MSPGLIAEDGRGLDLDGLRWTAAADAVDRRILDTVRGPALDVGCGPGRHVVALSEAGVPTLGIDITPAALTLARAQGAPVLRRCVFDRVPGAGRWRTALLLDGNLGIGGDPVALLRRLRELLASDGRVLVEVGGCATPPYAGRVRFTGLDADPGGHPAPWFEWVTVTTADLAWLSEASGFVLAEVREAAGRWFAWLDR